MEVAGLSAAAAAEPGWRPSGHALTSAGWPAGQQSQAPQPVTQTNTAAVKLSEEEAALHSDVTEMKPGRNKT